MPRRSRSSMRSPASTSIAAYWRSASAPPMPSAEALLAGLGPRALVVALSAIANHDNMGGICRNAAAFGADAVILDGDCCDPFYRKAIRVSVGAALTLPFARVGTHRRGARPAFRPRLPDAGPVARRHGSRSARCERPDRVAAIFGAEGPGLTAGGDRRARPACASPWRRAWIRSTSPRPAASCCITWRLGRRPRPEALPQAAREAGRHARIYPARRW